MQSGKIKLKAAQLNYFRRLARKADKEILALLVGEVTSPTITRVDYFWYPLYAEQTKTCVSVDNASFLEFKKKAEALNLKIVGTIHSHGNWVPILSPTDYKGHVSDGDRISGIVGVNKSRTRVYFWIAESALPLRIEYI